MLVHVLDSRAVAIYHMSEGAGYPSRPPFHPPTAYPEYPFGARVDGDNHVYAAVRGALELLGLDSRHAGDSDWNPLGELIEPGDQVLLKPNLVQQFNGRAHDPRSVVTHGSVIRAVLDYVYIALRGEGRIVIGDSPVQMTDMAAVLRVTGLDGVLDFYASQQGIEVAFADFRIERAVTRGTMIVGCERLAGAPGGYVAVDLGRDSYLDAISTRYLRYRVTDYDKQEMMDHHNENTNEYLIPRVVLESDVVLNLPKLKTHRKVGMTASLKNVVGINGCKDWLPHHSSGSVQEGGDEYRYPCWRKRIDTFLDEQVDVVSYRWQKYVCRLGRLLLRASNRLAPYPDPYTEGSWWGNDTLWRTVLDLNRILLYADKQGRITDRPQRRYLSLVDGILAGEGEGPLEPTPRLCGLVIAGHSPALVDGLCARIVGFDPERVPLIRHALQHPAFLVTPDAETHGVQVRSNERRWESAPYWGRTDSLAFRPSHGWEGHIEL